MGIAREVNTVHRDGSTLPIEIQVTEQVSPEGIKSFIGRIRHQKIEMKVPRGILFFIMIRRGSEILYSK